MLLPEGVAKRRPVQPRKKAKKPAQSPTPTRPEEEKKPQGKAVEVSSTRDDKKKE